MSDLPFGESLLLIPDPDQKGVWWDVWWTKLIGTGEVTQRRATLPCALPSFKNYGETAKGTWFTYSFEGCTIYSHKANGLLRNQRGLLRLQAETLPECTVIPSDSASNVGSASQTTVVGYAKSGFNAESSSLPKDDDQQRYAKSGFNIESSSLPKTKEPQDIYSQQSSSDENIESLPIKVKRKVKSTKTKPTIKGLEASPLPQRKKRKTIVESTDSSSSVNVFITVYDRNLKNLKMKIDIRDLIEKFSHSTVHLQWLYPSRWI